MKVPSFSPRPDILGLCLIATLVTACSFDASQLRALSGAGGVAGSDGATAPGGAKDSDAAATIGADGPSVAERPMW